MKPQFRHCAAARLFGLLLFVLAVSPVTAPFSTCDLVAVLCGSASAAGASIQSKASPDEPVSNTGGAPVLEILQHAARRHAAADQPEVARHSTLDVPLRV